jgi:hypothetical protein
MSDIAQLRDFFPDHELKVLLRALEAASGEVDKAADFLTDGSNFAALHSMNSSSRTPTTTISATRINIAEQRLTNPAFRQPLRNSTPKPKLGHLMRTQGPDTVSPKTGVVKEESDTTKRPVNNKLKTEPAGNNLEVTILHAPTPIRTENADIGEVNSPLCENDKGNEHHPSLQYSPLVDDDNRKGVKSAEEFVHLVDSDDGCSSTVRSTSWLEEHAVLLDSLMLIFPAADRTECEEAIRRCNGDPTEACEMLEARRPADLVPTISEEQSSTPNRVDDDLTPIVSTRRGGLTPFQDDALSPDECFSQDEVLDIPRGQKRRVTSESDSPVSSSPPYLDYQLNYLRRCLFLRSVNIMDQSLD